MGPARKLHDKTLKADADMNRADWLTAAFGAAGVLGIGLGLWWADAVAGAAISTGIVKDGVVNLRQVVRDLMDGRPCTVDGEVSDAPERVKRALDALPWVEAVDVRLREEGHIFAGEVFITLRATHRLRGKLAEARATVSSVDWRVRDIVVEFTDSPERHDAEPLAHGPGVGRPTRIEAWTRSTPL